MTKTYHVAHLGFMQKPAWAIMERQPEEPDSAIAFASTEEIAKRICDALNAAPVVEDE